LLMSPPPIPTSTHHAHTHTHPIDIDVKDGERLPLAVKDMGSCEIYPQTISHNPNGRSVQCVYLLMLNLSSVLSPHHTHTCTHIHTLHILTAMCTGLWWCVVMGNTSFTRPWLSGTRVLAVLRSSSGQLTLLSKYPQRACT